MFEELAPARVVAQEFRGQTKGGRTQPLRLGCTGSDGSWSEYVVKLREPGVHDGTPYGLCLVREFVGSALARFLGLDVPPYAIVEIDDDFVASVGHLPEASRLALNRGANFGSLFVEGALEDAMAPTPDLWSRVIGFDAMSFNADRKVANPNVLWTGNTLYIIDHGLVAPLWTFGADGTNASTLYGLVNIRLHASAQRLAKSGQSYNEIPDRWSTLPDELRAWLLSATPSAWASSGEVNALLDFLWQRVSIAVPQSRELSTCLA